MPESFNKQPSKEIFLNKKIRVGGKAKGVKR
jgi:hypothetical protein